VFFCNLLSETNTFGLGAIPQLCLVSKLQELPLPGHKPRTVFWGVIFSVFVIYSLKETTLVWHNFSVMLSLQATETTLIGTRTWDSFFRVLMFLKSLPCLSMPSLVQIGLSVMEL
jgi:hypothetical protein